MAYVTSEQLQLELENLADELGISVSEALAIVTGRIDTNDGLIAGLQTAVASNAAAIEAITEMEDNGIESLAEKVKALNDMFTENGDLATDVLNRIAANTTAIGANATEIEALKVSRDNLASEIVRVEAKVDANNVANGEAISALDARILANRTASEARDTALGQRIDTVEATQIADKAELVQTIADNKAESISRDEALQAQVDALSGGGTGSVADLTSRMEVVEGDLNDKMVDGVLVKGLKTKVSDNAQAIVNEAARATSEEARIEAKVDALQGSGLVTGVICGRAAAQKFRIRLGQAAKSFDCGTVQNGDGEAI